MLERDAVAGEHPADEQAAVAIGRILFAAHDGNAIHCAILFESSNALAKESRLGDTVVENIPIRVVERISLRAAAQFLAHVAVLDAPALNRALDLRVVEVRHISRKRLGADIHEHLYGMPLQQAEEDVEGMIRVADGVDAGRVRSDGASY